jgi:molybdopterin synthase catalytic subunit/molybdopterin converting factor small subunit
MKVRVRLWGGLAEAAGFHEDLIEVAEGATAADLIGILEERAPDLARYREVTRIARNAELAGPEEPLADGDELSLLPPVAGGGAPDLVEIRAGPLDPAEAIRFASTPSSGGIGVFIGTVRDRSEGMAVSEIDYTAFEEMAVAEIRRVVAEARRRWPLHRVAVLHSTGRLRVGDASVVVAVSAEHRAEALEACRAIIDGLKERAPIWKHERGEDGARWVNLPETGPTPRPAG